MGRTRYQTTYGTRSLSYLMACILMLSTFSSEISPLPVTPAFADRSDPDGKDVVSAILRDFDELETLIQVGILDRVEELGPDEVAERLLGRERNPQGPLVNLLQTLYNTVTFFMNFLQSNGVPIPQGIRDLWSAIGFSIQHLTYLVLQGIPNWQFASLFNLIMSQLQTLISTLRSSYASWIAVGGGMSVSNVWIGRGMLHAMSEILGSIAAKLSTTPPPPPGHLMVNAAAWATAGGVIVIAAGTIYIGTVVVGHVIDYNALHNMWKDAESDLQISEYINDMITAFGKQSISVQVVYCSDGVIFINRDKGEVLYADYIKWREPRLHLPTILEIFRNRGDIDF